ncbi:Wadjet anti-phage system protein JetD domain-containing protein [Sporolactobacillus terrae]|uniref:Wadjet anti-phage system protein JetD domain-containing protein n=1 Tax=Sporolactobacillus terrae TaxID=269673 RepID=UPI0009E075DB|nr:DUF2220 domain-containing protein [Sporolactobacillus terrae]
MYHWSDIDLGGFRILARVRKDFFPDLYPYRMNEQELMNYSAYTLPIKGAYLEMLKGLLEVPELSDCYSCLSFMLEHKVKLEQEAMIE